MNLIITIKSFLEHNQFATGGLLIGMVAGIVATAKSLPQKIYYFCKDRIMSSIEIESQIDSYQWICEWLAKESKKEFRRVRPKFDWVNDPSSIRGRRIPVPCLIPAPGNYIIKYKRRKILVSIGEKEKMSKDADLLLGLRKTIRLIKFGTNTDIFKDILKDAYNIYCPERSNLISINTFNNEYWRQIDKRLPRKKETLTYDNGIINSILSDAQDFLTKSEWYRNMGIPWRRGYLLYGEPGNGKSSLALCLASELNLNICVLNLSGIPNDKELSSAMMSLPKDSILLLEDVDSAHKGRETKNSAESQGITFSGLLNALDGIIAPDGRILIMTTNHKDKLDPALIRSGRTDMHFYIGNATKLQLHKMFSRFYPNIKENLAQEFSNSIPEKTISMSSLQEYLLTNKTPEEAVKNLNKLLS